MSSLEQPCQNRLDITESAHTCISQHCAPLEFYAGWAKVWGWVLTDVICFDKPVKYDSLAGRNWIPHRKQAQAKRVKHEKRNTGQRKQSKKRRRCEQDIDKVLLDSDEASAWSGLRLGRSH